MAELDGLKSSFDFVTEVRGKGLLVALEFDREISHEVVQACLERGLLINPVKQNAVRFMPPLITQRSEVDEAMGMLKDALTQVSKSRIVEIEGEGEN
ncbi:MAG: hypothetical protein COS88_06575 [Chloroflexi bacterium CG07_land_8_20_14_0_80_51_10]|nr:MAG: hypothetical protein COS88_06575 [Chloroflexi bacterium CG07_land_8_20_14_0_80_51_10]